MFDPVDPRMLSFALTFLLLLLHHNPANSESPPGILPFSCKLAERKFGNLKQTREQVLLKHKSAQWRAYQMKYKSQKIEENQASLKNSLNECNNGGGNGSSEWKCEFSPDCYSHPLSPYHGQMMDGPLVCIHGKCDIMTDVVGEMCRGYNECDCRSNPEKCFCIMRECENRAWECHESKDCERMKKCKGKRCVCGGDSGATCEIDRNSGGNGTSVEEKLCEFTSDCPVHSFANYACNHGKCVSKGDALYDLCRDYTECDCRSNPEKCFCIMGQCENRAWECHKHRDCDRMKKCKGKRCVCRGATCEISWAVPLNSGQGDVKHGEDYDDEDVNGDGEKARGPGRSV